MALEEQLPTLPVPAKLSETAGSIMQSLAPPKGHCMHISAFHPYADDPKRQVEANHYCSHLSEDVQQCIIYDSHDTNKARLIGVEYVISRTVFDTLPEEEKKYWHSHVYECMSGMLVLPGLPQMREDMEIQKLVNTYGKTWHFWQVDRGDPLPYGEPKLMCSFTKDGEANAQLVKLRDEKFGISTDEKRVHRAGKFDVAPVHPKADQFEGFCKVTGLATEHGSSPTVPQ
jgi:hypothetical protein